MKKKSIKKVLLSGATTLALLVSTVTSTFAFVILNDEANISEFNFNIQNEEGLWISLDGVYYSQDINYSMIKNALEANINPSIIDADEDGYISDEDGFISLDEYIMNPVTLKANETLVSLQNYIDRLGQSSKRLSFAKDSLVRADDPSGSNNIWYNHELVDATSTDYLTFDLWFRIINNGDVATYEYNPLGNTTPELVPYNYSLKFTDYTDIEGEESTVKLSNNLTTFKKGTGELIQYGPKEIYDDPDIADGDGSYNRESITINSADAMRIAVLNNYEYIDWATKQTEQQVKDTTTTGLYVFETKNGLGSAAVKNEEIKTQESTTNTYTVYGLDLYENDPKRNAMYTYYNNTHPISPFTSGADYNESFSTIKEYTNTVLGTFNYVENTGISAVATNYSEIKLSICIYLEGWDADYFYGISANQLAVRLGFEIVETYNPSKDPTSNPPSED